MSEVVTACGGRAVQVRKQRHDGWNKARRAAFLDHLAGTANVSSAARSVDVSLNSAYDLRRRDEGFAALWAEAVEAGYARLEDELLAAAMGRGLNDFVPGESDAELPPFDAALALRLLQQRDAMAKARKHRPSYKRAPITEVVKVLRHKLDMLAVRLGRAV